MKDVFGEDFKGSKNEGKKSPMKMLKNYWRIVFVPNQVDIGLPFPFNDNMDDPDYDPDDEANDKDLKILTYEGELDLKDGDSPLDG